MVQDHMILNHMVQDHIIESKSHKSLWTPTKAVETIVASVAAACPFPGGDRISFWYRCAARRAANGGLKNG